MQAKLDIKRVILQIKADLYLIKSHNQDTLNLIIN